MDAGLQGYLTTDMVGEFTAWRWRSLVEARQWADQHGYRLVEDRGRWYWLDREDYRVSLKFYTTEAAIKWFYENYCD